MSQVSAFSQPSPENEDERLAQWCEQQAHDCETFVAFGERMGGSPDAIADFATPAANYRAIASRLRSPRDAKASPVLASAVMDLLDACGIKGAMCGVDGGDVKPEAAAELLRFAAKLARKSSGKPVVSDSGVRPQEGCTAHRNGYGCSLPAGHLGLHLHENPGAPGSLREDGYWQAAWDSDRDGIVIRGHGALASGQPHTALSPEQLEDRETEHDYKVMDAERAAADREQLFAIAEALGYPREAVTLPTCNHVLSGAVRSLVANYTRLRDHSPESVSPSPSLESATALSDVQGIADVLAKHRWVSTVPSSGPHWCACGWQGDIDGGDFRGQHDAHLASVLSECVVPVETKEQGAIQAECFEAMALAVGVLREAFEKRAFTTLPNLEGKAIAAEHRLDRALRKLNALTSESPVSVGESLDAPKEEQ